MPVCEHPIILKLCLEVLIGIFEGWKKGALPLLNLLLPLQIFNNVVKKTGYRVNKAQCTL